MKDKDLKNLKRLIKKIGKHKPAIELKQPDNPPDKEELNKNYKLNLKNLTLDKEG